MIVLTPVLGRPGRGVGRRADATPSAARWWAVALVFFCGPLPDAAALPRAGSDPHPRSSGSGRSRPVPGDGLADPCPQLFAGAGGRFVAGILVSETEYSHQVVADMVPFRDVFASVFFISVGMLVDLDFVVANVFMVVGLAIAVIVTKALICGLAVVALRFSDPDGAERRPRAGADRRVLLRVDGGRPRQRPAAG